ncbi:MAG: hypothetical protein HY077_12220 [Elusimicrobia bacterium]|nr:hypothetical protein [Elusimicrobiota bacterium]
MQLIPTLKWNIDFIRKEAGAIDSSAKEKARVRGVCDHFSDIIGQYEKDENIEKLYADLRKGFQMFDDIIRELDGNAPEKTMHMLLITHVADMMVVVYPPDDDVLKK